MLEKIRAISHHYLFKLFFILIAIVFALSLGDLGKSQPNSVAKIDSQSISLQEFIQARQELINQLGNQNNISTEQLNNLALKKLITQVLLKQEAEELGIKVSPETLAEYIRNDSSFHKDGVFDLEIYKKLLEQNNLSEKLLLKNLSDQVAAKFLTDSISVNMPLQGILEDYLYKYITEKRNISLLAIDTSKQSFTSFNEADLQEYYQQHQTMFQSKEKRSYSYIEISFDSLRNNSVITNEALQQEFQNNAAEYTLPETRDFYHFVAPTPELAQEVAASLKDNPDPAAVAKEFVNKNVISENFINHPSTSFVASVDPALFTLKENQISGVSQSDLGWHVFIVTHIHAREHEAFAQAKPKLEEKLRLKAAQASVYDLSNKIEDDIAAGANLKDIATNYNLKYLEVKDASGNDPVTIVAFQTGLHEESPVTEIKAMGQEHPQSYVVVRVDEVALAKTRDYAEIEEMVKDLYSSQLRNNLAKELSAVLQKNTSKIIKENKLDNQAVQLLLKPICAQYKVLSNDNIVISFKTQDLSRPILVRNADLPVAFIDEIFALDIGAVSNNTEFEEAKYGFAIVNKLVFNPNKNQQLYGYVRSITTRNYRSDFYDQYINYLQSKHKITINYALIENNPIP